MAKQTVTINGRAATDGNDKGSDKKLSHKEFVYKAIEALRTGKYKGIHATYSGFNSGFKEYFGTDPVAITTAMQKRGELVIVPCRGGVMLYLPQDAPEPRDYAGKAALAKIFA